MAGTILAGAPPILVYFSGDRDVHWGYGLLTHGHMNWPARTISVGMTLLARQLPIRATPAEEAGGWVWRGIYLI